MNILVPGISLTLAHYASLCIIMLCCEFAIDVFLEACANTSWLLMEVNDWHRAMALLVQGDGDIW